MKYVMRKHRAKDKITSIHQRTHANMIRPPDLAAPVYIIMLMIVANAYRLSIFEKLSTFIPSDTFQGTSTLSDVE